MNTRGHPNISRRGAMPALTLSLFVGLASSANEGLHRGPFSKIVTFGDSLTDTGNFYQLTGVPPSPYYQGRFSNGPLWVEYLASALGIELDPEDNYAVAGATTGRANENDIPGVVEFGGLEQQLERFFAELRRDCADRRALYTVWAGANDFFLMTGDPNQTIAQGVANTVSAIRKLSEAGARHIMVVNLPDLGLTPLGIASGNAGGLSFLCSAYNQYLDQALDQLENAGIRTIRLDSAAVLQSLVANPAENGLTNVTDAYLSTGGDPAGFLFWDIVHPTTRGHELVAEAAVEALLDHNSPHPGKGRGRGRGHGRIHSLIGLVDDWLRN